MQYISSKIPTKRASEYLYQYLPPATTSHTGVMASAESNDLSAIREQILCEYGTDAVSLISA